MEYDFVLTADESVMHNYHMSFMAGFLACVPRDKLPPFVRSYIEKKFFSPVDSENKRAKLAVLPLRKMESHLSDLGFNVIVASPQDASDVKAKAYFISTMDPFGIGPATTTMLGLAEGSQPYCNFFFERLLKNIRRKQAGAKILVGGPGTWEFGFLKGEQERLKIDCVFEGDSESGTREFYSLFLNGHEVPSHYKGQMRVEPAVIKGPSFWGMVEISRGCGRGCQFCDLELMSGVRWVPKDRVLREARVSTESPLVDRVTLLSEDTLRYGTQVGEWKINRKIVDLVKALSELGKPLSFTHSTFASPLSDPKVTAEFSYYSGLNESNLTGFQVGIETGSPRIMQRYMQGKLKPWRPEDWPWVVDQGMALMTDNFIIPHCTLVMGLEGEMPEDTLKTIELVEDVSHYPSLILPLFFVPLGVLQKDRMFRTSMLTEEQKELLVAATRHTAYWARKLPNWSGQLGPLDRLVFAVGSTYILESLQNMKKGTTIRGSWLGVVKEAMRYVRWLATRETGFDYSFDNGFSRERLLNGHRPKLKVPVTA